MGAARESLRSRGDSLCSRLFSRGRIGRRDQQCLALDEIPRRMVARGLPPAGSKIRPSSCPIVVGRDVSILPAHRANSGERIDRSHTVDASRGIRIITAAFVSKGNAEIRGVAKEFVGRFFFPVIPSRGQARDESPNAKLQSSKGAVHLPWSLLIGASLELGCWSLELSWFPSFVQHPDQPPVSLPRAPVTPAARPSQRHR